MQPTSTLSLSAVTAWLKQERRIKSAVLFGSSARPRDCERDHTAPFDLDLHLVASNPEARNQISRRLMGLRGKHFSEQLEEHRRTFVSMIATRFPYAPEAFSLAAGPRVTALGVLTPPRPPVMDFTSSTQYGEL